MQIPGLLKLCMDKIASILHGAPFCKVLMDAFSKVNLQNALVRVFVTYQSERNELAIDYLENAKMYPMLRLLNGSLLLIIQQEFNTSITDLIGISQQVGKQEYVKGINKNLSNIIDSNKDLSNTRNSNKNLSDIKDANNSKRELSDIGDSNKDLSNIRKSNRDLSYIEDSNKDLSDLENSKKDFSDIRDSNNDLLDLGDLNKELSDTRHSDKDLSDTRDSNKDLSDARDPDKDLSDTRDSNKDLSDARDPDKDLSDTRNSSQKLSISLAEIVHLTPHRTIKPLKHNLSFTMDNSLLLKETNNDDFIARKHFSATTLNDIFEKPKNLNNSVNETCSIQPFFNVHEDDKIMKDKVRDKINDFYHNPLGLMIRHELMDIVVNMFSLSAHGISWSSFERETMRQASFAKYPATAVKSADQLASSGFVYIGDSVNDKVKCYYCLAEKQAWQETDDIDKVHKSLSPFCPVVAIQSVNNVSAGHSTHVNDGTANFSSAELYSQGAQWPRPSPLDNTETSLRPAIQNNAQRPLYGMSRPNNDQADSSDSHSGISSGDAHGRREQSSHGNDLPREADSVVPIGNLNTGLSTNTQTTTGSTSEQSTSSTSNRRTVRRRAARRSANNLQNNITIVSENEHNPSSQNRGTIFQRNEVQPPVNSTVHQPHVNSSLHQPPVNSSLHQPPVNSSLHQPLVNSSLHQPLVNSSLHQPLVNSSLHQPLVNSNVHQHLPSHPNINSQVYSIATSLADITPTTDPISSTPATSGEDIINTPNNQTTLTYQALGIFHERPKYIQHAVLARRLQTFESWPPNHPIKKEDLAKSGMFFAGYGDCCRCFFCGGGLRNWENDDNPIIEHARWFSKCGFLRQLVGDDFLNTVKALTNSDNACNTITLSQVTEFMRNKGQRVYTNSERMITEDAAVRSVIQAGYHSEAVTAVAKRIKDRGELLSADVILREMRNERLGATAPNSEHLNNSLNEERLETLKNQNYALRNNLICKICMDKEVRIVFLPCGHLVSCQDCAVALQDCPVCRSHIRATALANISQIP